MFEVPEKHRLKTGSAASDSSYGNNGFFIVRSLKIKGALHVQASDGEGWEHVSISRHDRAPSWDDMSFVKQLFWGPEDFVVQMHVATAEHINMHPYCLHLWRKAGSDNYCEKPPSILVGYNT